MPNLHELEAAIPVAPLKLSYLIPLQDLASRSIIILLISEEMLKILQRMILPLKVMYPTIILPMPPATVLVQEKEKELFRNPSEEKIFLFSLMSAITVFPIP